MKLRGYGYCPIGRENYEGGVRERERGSNNLCQVQRTDKATKRKPRGKEIGGIVLNTSAI